MKVERLNAKSLSKEELLHLETLKSIVEKTLEDGQISIYESEHIQSLIWADSKVNYEELRIINETIHRIIGDILPDLEWRRIH